MTTDSDPRAAPADAEVDRAGLAFSTVSAAGWLALAALIVSLLACAAAVFSWYQVAVTGRLESGAQRGVMERLADDYDGLKQTQAANGDRMEALEKRTAALEQDIARAVGDEAKQRKEAIDAFRTEFNALSKSVEQVYRDLGRSVDTWMLEEVEQLLLLANQRLTLVGDTALAAAALRIADGKLEEIGDPALLPVRQRIAEELAGLARVPKLDVAGAALRLGALMDNIAALPLSEDMERPEWETGEAQHEAGGEPGKGGVERFARQVLDDLGNLVRVRQVDETRLPRLKPVQRFLVDENLRLSLAGARYALLGRQAAVFRQSLDAAREWTSRYFAVTTEGVKHFLDEIDALAALPVDRVLPPIDGSLSLLREKMKERAAK